MGKLTLILGGARSGKSAYAEKLALQHNSRVAYIATAQALDEEMKSRISLHQEKRNQNWQTLEIPFGIGQIVQANPPSVDLVILDCLTLLVSNILLKVTSDPDTPDENLAQNLVAEEIASLCQAIQRSSSNWIVVSNEVGMGLVPPYPLGRVYRDLLGWANQELASVADRIYLMLAGIPMRLVPEPGDDS